MLPANEDPWSALEACRPACAVERSALEGFAEDLLARLAHAGSVIASTYFSLALPVPEGAPAMQVHTRRAGAPGALFENTSRGDTRPPVAPGT
jgi:hypothetical protein